MTALKCNRKNTKSYLLTIKEGDTPKNINGYSVKLTVKKNTNDLDNDDIGALISKTVEATSEIGLVTISLTSDDTSINPGTYMFDIRLKNGSGSWRKSSDADKFIINGIVGNE
jgi:hypothetical protein